MQTDDSAALRPANLLSVRGTPRSVRPRMPEASTQPAGETWQPSVCVERQFLLNRLF